MMQKRKGYIENLIAEGEHVHQDFKYQITDARKIARSISAFANNDGGRLLVGVKDNGKIVGVADEEEIYMIEQAATLYCRPEQRVECSIYRVGGKNVLKVDIARAPVRPVKAPDENGVWKTYYRVEDQNMIAGATHVRIMTEEHSHDTDETVLSFGNHEKMLLGYLSSHEGITVSGFMRLAHISRDKAQEIIISLCRMKVIGIEYLHNGTCVVVSNQ